MLPIWLSPKSCLLVKSTTPFFFLPEYCLRVLKPLQSKYSPYGKTLKQSKLFREDQRRKGKLTF